jgi:hypothetical protein
MKSSNAPVKEAARRKAAEKKAAVKAWLDDLPADIGRNRIVDADTSAAFWGVSLPHWRRMYRSGRAPLPIKVSDRKLGWRIGDLVDGLAKRADVAA